MLLSNRKKIDLGPILVVCYTNHALDQFLEGIHKFQPKGIVRIGSRSSSEIMEGCSLKKFIYKLKRKYRYLPVDVKRNLDDAKGLSKLISQYIYCRCTRSDNQIMLIKCYSLLLNSKLEACVYF